MPAWTYPTICLVTPGLWALVLHRLVTAAERRRARREAPADYTI